MEFYDKCIAQLDVEGTGPEILEGLRQEAIRSLREDPPEQALTQTGQMVSALLRTAKRQEPPEQSMVDAINTLTAMMIDYLEHLSWRKRAVKTAIGWVYEQSSPSN